MTLTDLSRRFILARIPKDRPRGLGDVVAAGAQLAGIAPCAGCQKRQQDWNRKFPFPKSNLIEKEKGAPQ
jgi:hypothetical protein